MTEPPPLPGARSRVARHLFEAYLCAAMILVGIAGLIVPAVRARSIVAAFPAAAQLAWYAGLLVGGALTLTGLLAISAIGLQLERSGLLILAGLCASFSVASFAFAGWPSLTGSALLLSLAAACFVRSCQVSRDIGIIRRGIVSP